MKSSRQFRMSGSLAGILLLLVIAAIPSSAPCEEILGAGDPALSPDGKTIAFTYMGDIWSCPARGGDASRLTVHEAYDHSPVWSPDGSRIAFSSDREGNDDLFVIDRRGGRPEQLTWHSADDQLACWADDGENLLFTSNRESTQPFLYRTRKNHPHPSVLIQERVLGAALSPDGGWICWVKGYTPWWRKHYRGSASRELWLRRVGGGENVMLTTWHGDDDLPMWSPDGKGIYYISEGEDSTANVWKIGVDLTADPPRPVGKPEQLTRHGEWSVENASLSANGENIAYERHGKIWVFPTTGGETTELSLTALSDDKWNPIREVTHTRGADDFALSPEEDQIAFSVHGEIFVMEIEDGEGTDYIRRITRTPARERNVVWSPDGETIYFESDQQGNVDIMAVRSTDEEEKRLSRSRKTETVRLTDSPENDRSPAPSPDGKQVAFLRGIGYAWTMKTDGTGEKRILDSPDVLYTRWSPDSKWIAISQSNLGSLEDVFVFAADGSGDSYNISRSPMDDYSPYWTEDGERLAWATRDEYGNLWLRYTWLTREASLKTDAEREEEDKAKEKKSKGKDDDKDEEGDDKEDTVPPVKIDFDDLYNRRVTVTRLSGSYNPYSVSPDGEFYVVLSSQLGSDDLWLVNDKGDRIVRLTEEGAEPSNIVFEKDSRGIYFLHNGGKIQHLRFEDDGTIDRKGSGSVAYSAKLDINLALEAKQKFNEAWNLLRDGFYDARFHGVDWDALRSAYEARATSAYTVEEFSDVLKELIGELSASHLGVYPPAKKGVSTANPGFLVDATYSGEGVRVGKVFDDSPADREGHRIQTGDFIIEVDGEKISARTEYYKLWNGKADTKIDVTLAESPDGKNSRTVTVTPEGRRSMRSYLYEAEVDQARMLAEELSGGKVGYVRMRAMGAGDINRFEKDLWAEAGDKDALILDIRWNNGGSIHDQVITILQRRAYALMRNREREDNYNPVERWEKPVVCLINERSYSDGEIFPHAFKTLRLGTLLGVPTFGAVIGTQDVPLIDGTYFRIPGSGWYSLEGNNLENNGVTPDIHVESVPEEFAYGKDQQLERAVEVLLEKINSGSVKTKSAPRD